jgi:hypothetical protein
MKYCNQNQNRFSLTVGESEVNYCSGSRNRRDVHNSAGRSPKRSFVYQAKNAGKLLHIDQPTLGDGLPKKCFSGRKRTCRASVVCSSRILDAPGLLGGTSGNSLERCFRYKSLLEVLNSPSDQSI